MNMKEIDGVAIGGGGVSGSGPGSSNGGGPSASGPNAGSGSSGIPECEVHYCDLSEDVRSIALQQSRQAFQAKERSDYLYWQQCAQQIKTELDKAVGPTWHVIVGASFGAFVAHEVGHCFYASIGQMKVLAYKHG